jgi:hypothetical protein
MPVAGIHQHMKVMIYISQGYATMSGGQGNLAYPITPIMADFPISVTVAPVFG